MAETTTIARPYAQAVFELAREQNAMSDWSRMLDLCAQVVRDPALCELLGNPRMDRKQIGRLIIDVCGSALNPGGVNFVQLLAENRRLAVLPEIAQLFETLRAEAENVIEAELLSPQPVGDAQRAAIAAALKARLGREVTLTVKTDASLLGGAVVRAGDLVIDGSIRGRLAQLASAMSH